MDKKLEAIISKVVVRESGCHEWTGSQRVSKCRRYAYGQLCYEGKPWLAHRFFWIRANGPVPEGLELDHICRNKLCVNLAHLRAVTHRVNTQNRATCDRTECKMGHSLTLNSQGRKFCKTCRDATTKAWREAHRDRMNEISRKSYAKCGRKGLKFIKRRVGPNYGLMAEATI